jgi:hypothetical protein
MSVCFIAEIVPVKYIVHLLLLVALKDDHGEKVLYFPFISVSLLANQSVMFDTILFAVLSRQQEAGVVCFHWHGVTVARNGEISPKTPHFCSCH